MRTSTASNLLAEIMRYRELAARNGTRCFRLTNALKLARQFGVASRAFEGGTSVMLADWIDTGMTDGVPWPSSLFAQEWLRRNGFSECDGMIGVRATMRLVER